jgi:hypothetical protein
MPRAEVKKILRTPPADPHYPNANQVRLCCMERMQNQQIGLSLVFFPEQRTKQFMCRSHMLKERGLFALRIPVC